MNKFDKLYNLILESIITQDKAAMIARLKKADVPDATRLGNHLSKMGNNKLAEFICSLFCNHQVESLTDHRLVKVQKVVQNDKTINLQKYVNDLDGFVRDYSQQYQKIIDKMLTKNNSYLDSIPQFYEKQVYPNDVVIYKVRDSKAGMNAVRKIVDTNWGKDANPWCLISRKDNGSMDGAWSYWTHYNKFPKQIAFQNNKLIAFRASRVSTDFWWNRQDLNSSRLKPLEGKSINVPPAQWTEAELKQKKEDVIAAFKQQFKYNQQTKRWDTKDKNMHIRIDDQLLINGDLPFPIGTIYGNIGIMDCKELRFLNNGPIKVTGNIYFDRKSKAVVENSQMFKNYQEQLSQRFIERFHLIYNENTKRYDANGNVWVDYENIKNNQLPVPFGVIKGNFDITYCKNLKYTDYLPTKVTGLFDYPKGTRIGNMVQKSEFYIHYVEQTPDRFIRKHGLVYNPETKMYDCEYGLQVDPWDITGWDRIPVKLGKVKGFFRIERNSDIETLQNAPEEVGGYVMLMYNRELKSLRGFPKHVGGYVQLNDMYINTLEGMENTVIEGNMDIRGLAYLSKLNGCSFEKAFPKLKGKLICHGGQYRDNKEFIDKNNIKCGNSNE